VPNTAPGGKAQDHPCRCPDDLARPLSQSGIRQFPADAYPHLAELTIQRVLQPGYDYADEFEFGLELILDGLDSVRDTA